MLVSNRRYLLLSLNLLWGFFLSFGRDQKNILSSLLVAGAGFEPPPVTHLRSFPKGALPLWRSPQATCYPKSMGKIFSHTLFKNLIAFYYTSALYSMPYAKLVEARGIEPRSLHKEIRVSTCIACFFKSCSSDSNRQDPKEPALISFTKCLKEHKHLASLH